MSKVFDVGKFYVMLDQRRLALGMTWRELAMFTGIPACTFSRMARGKKPDADKITTLCFMFGFNLRDYAV